MTAPSVTVSVDVQSAGCEIDLCQTCGGFQRRTGNIIPERFFSSPPNSRLLLNYITIKEYNFAPGQNQAEKSGKPISCQVCEGYYHIGDASA